MENGLCLFVCDSSFPAALAASPYAVAEGQLLEKSPARGLRWDFLQSGTVWATRKDVSKKHSNDSFSSSHRIPDFPPVPWLEKCKPLLVGQVLSLPFGYNSWLGFCGHSISFGHPFYVWGVLHSMNPASPMYRPQMHFLSRSLIATECICDLGSASPPCL